MTLWLIIGILVPAAVIATVRLPSVWRDTEAASRPSPAWWLWGEAAWRALVRAQPVSIVCGWSLIVGSIFGSSLDTRGSIPITPQTIAASIGLLGFVLTGALMTSIQLFARPRFLIPPALRDQSGLLADILRSAKRRDKPPTRTSRPS